MATSLSTRSQYTSAEFVESCGAVVFDLLGTKIQVCLVHDKPKNEWVLAKGRRNCHESRRQAAIRETEEETGYRCRLFHTTMPTRAPAATEESDVPDRERLYESVTDHFMTSVIQPNDKHDIKLIFWYIAVVEDRALGSKGEDKFVAEFFSIDDAIQTLTFEGDRNILEKAIELVEEHLSRFE